MTKRVSVQGVALSALECNERVYRSQAALESQSRVCRRRLVSIRFSASAPKLLNRRLQNDGLNGYSTNSSKEGYG